MTIQKVGVLGCGLMGSGIAQVAASAGFDVTVLEVDQKYLDKGFVGIEKSLSKFAERPLEKGGITQHQKAETLARLKGTTRREDLSDCDIVIEAIIESVPQKKEMYSALDGIVKKHAIFASNTSSISITELMTATDRPERFIGLHFFNPVPVMELLEIVRGPETNEPSIAAARAFAAAVGKTPIVVRDSPGFATSRLGVVLGLEAIRMLEQGVASAEDIDRAMELGYNHPLGPLRLTDLVGLDVRLAIADHLHATLGGATYEAPALLREKVKAGHLGKKTGQGFYRWEK